MLEPGIDKHQWESEWGVIDPLLSESATEALAEADDLIARMMEARGFPLEEREGEDATEPETVREYVEAHRIMQQVESGESYDPGDIALAVEGYRNLYAYLLELGPTSDLPA